VAERASILHDQAVDPFLARLALERLQGRIREALFGSVSAAVLGIALVVVGNRPFGVAVLAGSATGALVMAYARSDRTALIARLVHQRSAYEIDEVRVAAERRVTIVARQRLARSVIRLVLEADGWEPANPSETPCYSRIREHRADFIAIAFHLARPESSVHPACAVLLERLLTEFALSPIHNELLPAGHVRMALGRIQAGISAGG
jgi:hypothetical protein